MISGQKHDFLKRPIKRRILTVIIMILLRLRYRSVTVVSPPLRTVTVFFKKVTYRYPALGTVTQSLHALPNVTSVTKRYRTLHTEFMNFRKFK